MISAVEKQRPCNKPEADVLSRDARVRTQCRSISIAGKWPVDIARARAVEIVCACVLDRPRVISTSYILAWLSLLALLSEASDTALECGEVS